LFPEFCSKAFFNPNSLVTPLAFDGCIGIGKRLAVLLWCG
jgi:hypothetical protein